MITQKKKDAKELMTFQDKVMSMLTILASRANAFIGRMEAHEEEIMQEMVIHKTTLFTWAMATHEAPRVELLKTHTFSRKRDAKELDNFLLHMERYFEAMALMDQTTKVRTTTMYLTDNATLLWHLRFVDIQRGTCTTYLWEVFKREIKRQFYPKDMAYIARKKIKHLKHTGLIQDYV